MTDAVAGGIRVLLRDAVPNKTGFYVVTNKHDEVMVIGDSAKLQSRWHAGHLNEFRQGKRANIEAKKITDAAGAAGSLLQGAAKEAAKNSGWMVLKQLTAAALKALKDELVDIFGGGKSTILARLQRFCEKVWSIVRRIIDVPLPLLKGIFEYKPFDIRNLLASSK